MITKKERLTITVDAHLVAAGNRAVASGRAGSLSGWVNLALTERIDKEQRLAAMAKAVAAYEERFGAISAEEMVAQQRADRQAAIVVRGRPKKAARRGKARTGDLRVSGASPTR